MNLNFIDRNFPALFCSLIMFPLPIALIIGACSSAPTQEEQAAINEGYAERLLESTVILTPKPGVECVVVRGWSNANPRMMSCYALMPPVQR